MIKNLTTLGIAGENTSELAQTLRALQFTVITDTDFASSAVQISRRLKDELFHVIVQDSSSPAIEPFVQTLQNKTSVTVVGQGDSTLVKQNSSCALELPATINELLQKIGYCESEQLIGEHTLQLNGDVIDPTAPNPVPLTLPLPLPLPLPQTTTSQPQLPSPPAKQEQKNHSQDLPDFNEFLNPEPSSSQENATTAPPQVVPVATLPVFASTQTPAAPPSQPPTPLSDDDFFASRTTTKPPPEQTRSRTHRGNLIFIASGKGGVGKTTTAISLAHKASSSGEQTIVIDLNRGQPDLQKYLRLGSNPLRCAYDAYKTSNPSDSILTPSEYGYLREQAKLPVPDFAIVLGPPSDLSDPSYVSAAVYGQIIDYARSISDLVIVDTQIVESHRTDLWDHAIIPALRADAWLIAITDESSPGVSNLFERLSEMETEGVTHARTIILAAGYEFFSSDDFSYFQNKFSGLGTFIGSTGFDEVFRDQINLGKITQSQKIEPAICKILERVSGRSDLYSGEEEMAPKRKMRMFGKKKK